LKEEEEDSKVRVQVLQLIKTSTEPLLHRLDELLRDHYTGNHKQSDLNLTYLIEHASATRILLQCLDKYINIALDSQRKFVLIPFTDFTIITHTSKVVEQGYRIKIGQSPLWTH